MTRIIKLWPVKQLGLKTQFSQTGRPTTFQCYGWSKMATFGNIKTLPFWLISIFKKKRLKKQNNVVLRDQNDVILGRLQLWDGCGSPRLIESDHATFDFWPFGILQFWPLFLAKFVMLALSLHFRRNLCVNYTSKLLEIQTQFKIHNFCVLFTKRRESDWEVSGFRRERGKKKIREKSDVLEG